MMRTALLYLSRNQLLHRFILGFPLARRASRRFVAGETMDEAIAAVKALQEKNILSTIDHLGESVSDEADTQEATGIYLELLDRIEREWAPGQVRPHTSLKLTQLGLDLDLELCQANLSRVLDKARAVGTFVRVDMESSAHTERTIAVYRNARAEFGATVGIVIQSYLYRSEGDVRGLINDGMANIRLCKGAYQEPETIAFPLKKDVDASLVRLMEMMLSAEGLARASHAAMATHDEKIIEATKAYVKTNDVPPGAFEFQMLYGIRRDLQEKLAREGYTMRAYVPFGDDWYPYFMRRLAERPANLWFILSNLFKA
jgi:proline dehydrogenase